MKRRGTDIAGSVGVPREAGDSFHCSLAKLKADCSVPREDVYCVMNDPQVEVRDGDIWVAKRGTPFAVTYRKNSVSPILEDHDILEGPEISSEEAVFLAAAWNAAYKKAKALGWP